MSRRALRQPAASPISVMTSASVVPKTVDRGARRIASCQHPAHLGGRSSRQHVASPRYPDEARRRPTHIAASARLHRVHRDRRFTEQRFDSRVDVRHPHRSLVVSEHPERPTIVDPARPPSPTPPTRNHAGRSIAGAQRRDSSSLDSPATTGDLGSIVLASPALKSPPQRPAMPVRPPGRWRCRQGDSWVGLAESRIWKGRPIRLANCGVVLRRRVLGQGRAAPLNDERNPRPECTQRVGPSLHAAPLGPISGGLDGTAPHRSRLEAHRPRRRGRLAHCGSRRPLAQGVSDSEQVVSSVLVDSSFERYRECV